MIRSNLYLFVASLVCMMIHPSIPVNAFLCVWVAGWGAPRRALSVTVDWTKQNVSPLVFFFPVCVCLLGGGWLQPSLLIVVERSLQSQTATSASAFATSCNLFRKQWCRDEYRRRAEHISVSRPLHQPPHPSLVTCSSWWWWGLFTPGQIRNPTPLQWRRTRRRKSLLGVIGTISHQYNSYRNLITEKKQPKINENVMLFSSLRKSKYM